MKQQSLINNKEDYIKFTSFDIGSASTCPDCCCKAPCTDVRGNMSTPLKSECMATINVANVAAHGRAVKLYASGKEGQSGG